MGYIPRWKRPQFTITQRVARFTSPITGKLQVYVLANSVAPYDGLSTVNLDPTATKNYINSYYQGEGIDAICDNVKAVCHPVVDWVLMDNWVAAETVQLEDGRTTFVIPPVVIALLAYAAFVCIKYVLPAAILLAIAWAFKEYVINPLIHPKIFYAYDGTGPMTREEAYTYNAAHNPDKWVDPNTTTVLDPTQPDFEEKKNFIIQNTPAGWGAGFDITGIVWAIVIVVTAVVVIPQIPRVIEAIAPKKE